MIGKLFSTMVLILLAPALVAAGGGDSEENEQARATHEIKHEVVVTAARLETPLRETAASITVISGEELARTGRTTIVEALQTVLGSVVLQNGGKGATASLMLRGAGSEHTLVLIDGLELNDPVNPARSFDLAHLTLADVDRIEILRGPQSPLYGSDALGGVINIITRLAEGKPGFGFSAAAGGLDAISGALGFNGSTGRLQFALSVAHDRTSGVSAASELYEGNGERDAWKNSTLAARLGFRLSERTVLSFNTRYSNSTTELDNFGGPFGDDPNSRQGYEGLIARLGLETWIAEGKWRQSVNLSVTGSKRTLDNPVDESHPYDSEKGDYSGELLKLDWQNDFFLSPGLIVTAGLEHEHERASSEYSSTSSSGTYESPFPPVTASSTGIYFQSRLSRGRNFFLVIGARLDKHSRAGSAVTFKIAPAYIFESTGTKLKATFGTGFKAPSLYQLFAPATAWGPVGSESLRSEKITGWETGLEQPLFNGRALFGLSYFYNGFRNLIQYDYLTGYVNVGRARTAGFEGFLTVDLGRGFKARFNYTRLSARDLDSGEPLLRRPHDKFSAELSGRFMNRLDFILSSTSVGRRRDRDYSAYPYPAVNLPAYFLFNVYFSTPVNKTFTLFLKLDNILAEKYECVWGYGTVGRTVEFGMRASI